MIKIGKSIAVECIKNIGSSPNVNNNCIASIYTFNSGIGRLEVTTRISKMRKCGFREKS